jgi:hypothetical protein
MTDDEIAKAIARECGVIVFLQLVGRKDKAQLFANHVLRLVYTYRVAVERWMKARQASEAKLR